MFIFIVFYPWEALWIFFFLLKKPFFWNILKPPLFIIHININQHSLFFLVHYCNVSLCVNCQTLLNMWNMLVGIYIILSCTYIWILMQVLIEMPRHSLQSKKNHTNSVQTSNQKPFTYEVRVKVNIKGRSSQACNQTWHNGCSQFKLHKLIDWDSPEQSVCSLKQKLLEECRLTAGKAKNEIPRRANPADSIRPVHVFGVLSP